MTSRERLGAVPSVPEGILAPGVPAGLPASVPAPPWHSTVEALLWCGWSDGARGALPPALRGAAAAPLVLGGLVAYVEGPVGPYREAFGAVPLLRGVRLRGHVPFMAVDSAAALLGGRLHWALPKVPARFVGDPGRPGTVAVAGDGWSLRVDAVGWGPSLPVAAVGTCEQVTADGGTVRFTVRFRGRARLGAATLREAAGPSLGSWWGTGRRPAVLVRGRQSVLAARQVGRAGQVSRGGDPGTRQV